MNLPPPPRGSARRRSPRTLLALGLFASSTVLASSVAAQPSKRDLPLRATGAPTPPAAGIGATVGQPTPGATPASTPATGPGSGTGQGGQPPGSPPPGANAPGAAPPGAGAPSTPGALGKAPDIEFKAPKPGSLVNINMSDVDLTQLVETISNFTGRRFIFGGKIRPGVKATIVSPKPVTAAEAYEAFLSVLQTNGMTVIPQGRYLKIIESAGISNEQTEVLGTATPVPNADRYMTRLYRLRHADATEVSNVLAKLKTKDADITVYAPSNLLILTDTGSNILRMLRIVEELDAGGAGEQIWMQPIHHVSAQELAQKLGELVDSGSGRARLFADDRNNQLIIVATEADYLRMLELVKRIDVHATGEGGIHVLGLQHTQCDELSATLGQILGGGGGGGASGGARGAKARKQNPAAGRGGQPQPAQQQAATSISSDGGGVFEQEVKVTCDVATNSLVAVSTLRDYIELRNLIERLDRPRRQVFLEAVIMDIDVKHSRNLGLGYHGGASADLGGGGNTLLYGGLGAKDSLAGIPSNLEALAFGVRGPDLPGSQTLLGTGRSIPAFGIVLSALATNGDANLLATPHVLATDNITAEINIGANIAIQQNVGGLGNLASLAGGAGAAGGAAAGLGALGALGLGAGFQAPRQDVGIKLSITPHVNDSDQIRMEISEEFSNAGAAEGALGVVPINKRTAETTVIVRDQQTVVIGGLVREEQRNKLTKIPILGDIPVLGALFRSTDTTTTKSNLLLVLTPHIVRDPADLRRIFERKMQERQEFLDRYFVFDETRSWQPPIDYARSIGLVEQIRQTQLDVEERERLRAELTPKRPQTHDPVKPIALPSVAGPGSSSGPARPGSKPASSAAPPPAPQPAQQPAAAPSTPRAPVRIPGGRATNPQRYRIE
ncbi:MAG: type II secretion system secretin GspD [Deltaproteobacteria bacterium]|nr:type II secretion system secretin GspD [Deltaproteobacteria bacterium]